MNHRDFAIGLLLAAAVRPERAQAGERPHRIAIVVSSGPVTIISAAGGRIWEAFFGELRRLGEIAIYAATPITYWR